MKPGAVALLLSFVFLAAGLTATANAQDHAEHYVLDAFGGVHAGGGAPVISPATPYFGFDVAADIEYIPVATATTAGDGILVLDKFGGVHAGGALAADPPAGPPTPYFGFDAARGVVYRDIPPRLVKSFSSNQVDVNNTGFLVLKTVTINAPAGGQALAIASIQLGCATTSSAATSIEFHLRLPGHVFGVWREDLSADDCAAGRVRIFSISQVYALVQGTNTFWLEARKAGGTNNPRIKQSHLTALSVDQDENGG